ncbi:MAG TPA: NADH-quinone oxidoreductase subunit NuoG [Actinomycetota bacterium]|nr:NADH-quinone oxidoreductase subunit NuoG [Actinomycetota bacterium]
MTAERETVTLTIDGREVETEKGRLLIDVAEELGIFVPRFCYHPGMKSVAVCRMCLVKVEGMPKLVPSCSTPVSDGMVVETNTEEPAGAQEQMLEFLLINHPLDCPICDRGGECPLQDQTYRHGPGSSRYIEPKRSWEKALDISQLVVLDRERCVLCWRCIRFCDEISGDRFIQLVDRGAGTQILTFADEPFDSYFSGNTIQICPVGALTAATYRFVSRPWDLKNAPGVCSYCAVGCPVTNEERGGKLVRVQALPNENVNDFWICDKGRFAFHYVDSAERLTNPLVRGDDGFATASWTEALAAAAEGLRDKSAGVICGGHLTTEDAYAAARFARKTLGTKNIDSRLQDDGAPYELALEHFSVAGSTATMNDVETARTIVWCGPDPKETLPVLYLRLRKAVVERHAKLIVVGPRRISLDDLATHVVRCRPRGEAGCMEQLLSAGAPGAADIGDPLVVCWGPAHAGRDETAGFAAALNLAHDRGGKILVCPPHAGSQGLIDMGVHPALEPGYNKVVEPGMGTRAMLEAAASGDLDALVLVGADVLSDFPDADLARRAMENVGFSVVIELFPTETARFADVVLPAAAAPEREGTFTNLERRLQKLEPLMPPPGTAREPWRALTSLARALGDDWRWASFDDVWADIKKNVPTHKAVDPAALAQEIPPASLQYESGFEPTQKSAAAPHVAGPGGQYPKGFRQGAPFHTGQSWPLSWELRAFEARQRPGSIPVEGEAVEGAATIRAPDGVRAAPADGFELLSGRLLYDEGAMVSKTRVLRELQKPAYVEMNDEDVKSLGLADGDEVRITGGDVSATCRVTVGDIAPGTVFVPYHQKGLAANTLISAGRVTIEAVR